MPRCVHGPRCGAGCDCRRLVCASGDVRRPMPLCTDGPPSCRRPMPSWMHEHRCRAGFADRRLVRASGDVRRPMPSCTHGPPSCRRPMPCCTHEHRRGAGRADCRLVCASGDVRRPMPSCTHVQPCNDGSCRVACTGLAAEQAVTAAVSCVRAAMSKGPCHRVHIGHRRADGSCHLARTSTVVVRAVPTSLSCVRVAMSDGPRRRVLIGHGHADGPCPSWMHEHRCGAGRADRRLVCASGDDRRPMPSCTWVTVVPTAQALCHVVRTGTATERALRAAVSSA